MCIANITTSIIFKATIVSNLTKIVRNTTKINSHTFNDWKDALGSNRIVIIVC